MSKEHEEWGYLERKAWEVLKKYPLCDRCLGRLFARLGHGLSNKDRGRAIKTSLTMTLHKIIIEGAPQSIFTDVAPNIGGPASGLYRKLTGEDLEVRACAICGGRLETFIEETVERAIPLIKAYGVKRFIVGARVSPPILEREERIKEEFRLEHGESIRAEIRREIGKLIQERIDAVAEFERPEATVLVEFPSGAVWIQVNSLLLRGRYWKLGRMISQAYWPTPEGPKYFSIEQALWPLLRLTGGERVILHASGREDVDARMLGTGRPMVVEIKVPRKRGIPLHEMEEAVNKSNRWVKIALEGHATRQDITLYKSEEARKEKTYKALVAVEDGVAEEELRKIEEELTGKIIMQRTPTRVLHRRPDILRRRRVLEISCKSLTEMLVECLITAEGGLYVKELISGDNGRTTPSFTEILDRRAECVELDVVAVKI